MAVSGSAQLLVSVAVGPSPSCIRKEPECGLREDREATLPSPVASFLIKVVIPYSNNSSPDLLACWAGGQNELGLGNKYSWWLYFLLSCK